VFFGTGNGKLTRSDRRPAGALVCLDAATGRRLWRYPVPDAVLSAPAVAGERVYFGSRDRHCYCLDRHDGRLCWRHDLGSPVVAAPVAAGLHLYVVAEAGPVFCLGTDSGAAVWQFDVAKHALATPELVSAPSLARGEGRGLRLYLAGGLRTPISYAAVVYCLNVPAAEE
jgi:outer membrane protein assembly factor BamB